MTYFAAFLLVTLSAAGAGVASWLVGQLFTVDARRRHHEVGAPVFQQIGVMFSVLLAFVFSEVWGEYRTAGLAINGECGALHVAAMLASALPNGEGQPVTRAIATYAKTVVNVEWPMMANRERSPQAAEALHTALRQAANLQDASPVTVAIQAEVVSLLAQAHSFRETRTFQLSQGMPPLMWFMLIAISLVLIGFVVCAGLENPGHVLFAAIFTGSTVLVLVLVRMLDFPFEGALALPSTDFVKLLGEVSALVRAGS